VGRWRSSGAASARWAEIGSVASGVVGQAALVVTGVITTRTLGPTDRGYLALLVLVPTVLLLSGTLGLPVATTYFIASDRRREAAVLRAVLLPITLQVALLSVLQAAILWALVRDDPSRVWWAAIVTLPILLGSIPDTYGKAILQGQARYTAFNVLRNAYVFLYLVGVVVLFAIGQTGIVQFALAWMLSTVIGAMLSVGAALRSRAPADPTAQVSRRRMFGYGLRSYLIALSPVATFRLDQAAIGLFLAPKDLGLYVAGLAITGLPGIVARGLGMIALPQVAQAGGAGRDERLRRYFFLSIALTGIIVLVLEVLAGWLVPFFFGSQFDAAVSITRILLLGTLFWGIRRVLTDAVSGSGRPGLGSIAEIASWVTAIPAFIVLTPIWGVDGVAAATTISSAASLLALIALVWHSNARLRRRGAGPAPSVEPVE
jgi:O-antigen/teichoic acid export membrane protein